MRERMWSCSLLHRVPYNRFVCTFSLSLCILHRYYFGVKFSSDSVSISTVCSLCCPLKPSESLVVWHCDSVSTVCCPLLTVLFLRLFSTSFGARSIAVPDVQWRYLSNRFAPVFIGGHVWLSQCLLFGCYSHQSHLWIYSIPSLHFQIIHPI